jgi:iron complex transport system substrate-binding protein
MRFKFSVITLANLLLFFACIQHDAQKNNTKNNLNDPAVLSVEFAKGFKLIYRDGYVKILTHSFGENAPFADSIYLRYSPTANIPSGAKIIEGKVDRFACQSTTHLSFINELNAVKSIRGVCGLNFIVDQNLKKLLVKNNVQEICQGEQLVTEALLMSEAQLYTIYPFGSLKDDLPTQGLIPTLFIGEYLEETQLARLEWIKLFGLLIGESELAEAYFNEVKLNYDGLKNECDSTEKTFLMNVPYKDIWYMPSSQSVGVELIEDAGINYIYANQPGTENLTLSNEKVWNDGLNADYWFIIAERPIHFSLADLIQEQSVYAEFKSVQNGNVFLCNTAEVDYFAQGTIEPDVILKDIQWAVGQRESYQPKYFRQLK